MGSAASTSNTCESGKPRAVMVCHSSQESSLKAFLATARDGGETSNVDDIVIITDMYPRDRQHRAEFISRTQAAFVAIDPMLQRSSELIETLSYLKDQRKTVISGPLTYFSRPSGAIGAVCLALNQWDPLLFAKSERFAYWTEKYELLTAEVKGDDNNECDSVNIDAIEMSPTPQIFFVSCKDDDADRVFQKFAHGDPVPGGLALSGEVTRCQHNLESDLEQQVSSPSSSRKLVLSIMMKHESSASCLSTRWLG